MSFTFLLEEEEESTAASYLDIPLSVRLKLGHTSEKSYSKDSEMEFSQSSQSGMMLKHSMENLGEELMQYVEGSHAATFLPLEIGLESKERKADYGARCSESFAKFDPNTFSWRTSQKSLFEEWEEFLETWPKAGMMLNGTVFRLEPWERDTTAKDFSLWVGTPTAEMAQRSKNFLSGRTAAANSTPSELVGSTPHPEWVEELMGFPIGATAMKPLEWPKFQQWLNSHGKH